MDNRKLRLGIIGMGNMGSGHLSYVLTEKPAGVYARQVREMNGATEKSGVRFAIMFNQRTNPV